MNPKLVREENLFSARIKVKMEGSPVESGICPDETLNPKLVRINLKLVREEILFFTRSKVKMEGSLVNPGSVRTKH